ncbi:MAG: flagellar biosynthetic protein FliR [Pseudomonadota bacterium]
MDALFQIIAPFFNLAAADAAAFIAVFARISGMVYLLPGVGEQTVSMRVRLAVAFAIAIASYPILRSDLIIPDTSMARYAPIVFAEMATGLALGLASRFMIFVLQLAGSIIAQNASIAQIFGQSVANDTQTPITALLTMAGIALALSLGVHIEAVKLFIASYGVFAFGQAAGLEPIALWAADSGAKVFSFAFSLSAPFLALGIAYNLAIGAANRAMPQLMVAFVGAPAITGAGLLLLALSVSVILTRWSATVGEGFFGILTLGP